MGDTSATKVGVTVAIVDGLGVEVALGVVDLTLVGVGVARQVQSELSEQRGFLQKPMVRSQNRLAWQFEFEPQVPPQALGLLLVLG